MHRYNCFLCDAGPVNLLTGKGEGEPLVMRQQSLTRLPIDFGDSSADAPDIPNVEVPKEVFYNPDDTCSKHPCYDEETGVCPKLGYKITLELAKRQRLCDILDEPKKPKQARVNRA